MASDVIALGIDYGTSNTVAMLRWLDGRVQPLLFEGSPLLPSAVYVDGDGRRIVGQDALHHGRFEPAGLETNPKRLIDDESAWLGRRPDREGDAVARTRGAVAPAGDRRRHATDP